MSAPLTPERLAEIAALVQAATPGPWCADSWEIYQGAEYVAGLEWVGETCDVDDDKKSRADAAFIASARTAVPELLAEVERLRTERDAYCDRVDTITAVARGNKRHVQEMYTDLQKAHAEVERLTALVAAMHAAAAGETRPPLLGLVDDVAITRSSFLAQQNRAETLDGIARELAARVAELDEWKRRVTEEVEEFEDAAKDDPRTPQVARLMIANLRHAMGGEA